MLNPGTAEQRHASAMGVIDKILGRRLRSAEVEPDLAAPTSASVERIVIEARNMAPVLSDILAKVAAGVVPGITTIAINDQIDHALREAGLEPAMKGYNGFPMSATVSVNEQILHAVPSARQIASGDLIKIQTAGRGREGFVAQGWTFGVGRMAAESAHVLTTANAALRSAAAMIRAGARVGDVSAAIQATVEGSGCSVIRRFVGSGIGRMMHQPPSVPGFGVRGTGARLKRGEVLHVHVILKAGSPGLGAGGPNGDLVVAGQYVRSTSREPTGHRDGRSTSGTSATWPRTAREPGRPSPRQRRRERRPAG